jgi:hypothetical protein
MEIVHNYELVIIRQIMPFYDKIKFHILCEEEAEMEIAKESFHLFFIW